MHLPPLAARGASRFGWAGIAGCRLRPVDHDAFGGLGLPSPQHPAVGTTLRVALGIGGEVRGARAGRPLVKVWQRDGGVEVLVRDRDDGLDCPGGRVASHLAWSDPPAEPRSSEHVEAGQVLHHVGRGHQDLQDDAGLAAIHGRVIVVPDVEAALLERHQGSVGIGRAGLEVSAPSLPF
jgi:hypothetical protein